MGLLSWIAVGFIAGGLARRVTGARKRGCLSTIVVGVLGGLIGGALFNAIDDNSGVTEFGLWSIFVAFIGACLLLTVLQILGGGGARGRR